jgi:GTP-dependent phosphoenolpyruvate carboxykinase
MNMLEVGKTGATKQPKIFFVNWFRPDEDCWVTK